jgi:hypothetical protein
MRHLSTPPWFRRTALTLAILLLAVGYGPSTGHSTGAPAKASITLPLVGGAGSSGALNPSSPPSAAATMSPSAPAATSIAGTITWNATTSSRVSPDFSSVWIVSGTMDLVLDESLGEFAALPGKSTYAYDLEHVGCSPTTHQEGTLETSIQSYPEDGVAQALISGPMGQELELMVSFDDAWLVTCPPGLEGLESVIANAFPGCWPMRQGTISATLDASGNYIIACDIDTNINDGGIVVTGRIEGILSPVAAP